MRDPVSVTVTAIDPRVTVALSGSNDVPLRPSALLENIAVGERLVVVQAANGGFYAVERESLYYAPPHGHPYAADPFITAKEESDPPETYPDGVSIFQIVSTTPVWTHGYGQVVTIKTSLGRVVQFHYAKNGPTHTRYLDPADQSLWGPWYNIVMGNFPTPGPIFIGGSNFRVGTDVGIEGASPQHEFFDSDLAAGSAGRRFWFHHNSGKLYILIDTNDDGAWDSPHPFIVESSGNVTIGRDLNVIGAKNAQIPDPDDPTVGYRFAAMEADEPGLLFKRLPVEITTDDKASKVVDLPTQWAKIAEKPDAVVIPVGGEGTTQHDTRTWPRAEVDITVPNVTIYAPPGRYSIWVLACRKDASVQNWQHVVPIEQEETA